MFAAAAGTQPWQTVALTSPRQRKRPSMSYGGSEETVEGGKGGV